MACSCTGHDCQLAGTRAYKALPCTQGIEDQHKCLHYPGHAQLQHLLQQHSAASDVQVSVICRQPASTTGSAAHAPTMPFF